MEANCLVMPVSDEIAPHFLFAFCESPPPLSNQRCNYHMQSLVAVKGFFVFLVFSTKKS